MSVEKLCSSSSVIQEGIAFTQIPNEVIVNIKDNDSFRVWVYLQSKIGSWKVIKQDVKKVCEVGDRKMEKIFSYLRRASLIKYVQDKGTGGRFKRTDIMVMNGTRFDRSVEFIPKSEDVLEDNSTKRTAPPVSAAAENGGCGNAGLLNKDITKQRTTTKNLCSSDELIKNSPLEPDDDDPLAGFDHFWKLYRRKQKKQEAERIWIKLKLCKIAHIINFHVQERFATEWKYTKDNFLPLPSTFLNGRRWEDEILSATEPKESPVERAVRLCLS